MEALNNEGDMLSNHLQIQKGAKMFFPGDDPDFITSAMVISKASGNLEKITSDSPLGTNTLTPDEIEKMINADN